MASPLYNFQKDTNNKREENKNKFINEYYYKLEISKRYISPFEMDEIFKHNNINKKDLEDIINEGNRKFISSTKMSISKYFNNVLSSNDFIDDELRNKLKTKFHQCGYDFYEELNCDEKIDKHNNDYKIDFINNFKNDVNSYEFIDDEIYKIIKSKYNDFNCFLIKKSFFTDYIDEINESCKQLKMSETFDEFNKELNNYEFIDEIICDELKSRYNDFNYKYCDESDFYHFIDKRNEISIQTQSENILKEIYSILNEYEEIVYDDDRLKLQNKYNKYYYKFYDELDIDKKIDDYNKNVKPKIIQKILSYEDGYIKNSRISELKSRYAGINWDYIVMRYNKAYENNKASFTGLSSYYIYDFMNYKSRLTNNSIFKLGFDRTKIQHGVYYLYKYVPKRKRYGFTWYENKLSLGAWKFKDGYEYAIDFFTKDLIEAVSDLSNTLIKDNIDSVALISIPPSKTINNIDATMRKSIYRIKKYHNSHDECEKEILDYGNLLYRFRDVPTSHLERPATYDEHINSIVCTKRDLSDENIAFVLLDDVTTSGNIMKSCRDILVKHGADSQNIYKLAIFATGEWR